MVQKAVNREQNEQMITELLTRAKEQGFQSTNLDMIYGSAETEQTKLCRYAAESRAAQSSASVYF